MESWIQVERDPFPAGFSGAWHDHPRAQLIYPGRGVMVLHTRHGQWVVPPLQGCWLPAGEEHRVETSAGFEMLSAYCRGPLLRRLPERCGVVAVSPLLREVILALQGGGATGRARHRLCLVFADELRLEPAPRLFLQPLVVAGAAGDRGGFGGGAGACRNAGRLGVASGHHHPVAGPGLPARGADELHRLAPPGPAARRPGPARRGSIGDRGGA